MNLEASFLAGIFVGTWRAGKPPISLSGVDTGIASSLANQDPYRSIVGPQRAVAVENRVI